MMLAIGSDRLAAAHIYAQLGLKVMPIRPGRKEPLTAHGSLDATNDHDQIDLWWSQWPDANVGIATGYLIDVIDLDGWDAQGNFDTVQDQPWILGAVETPRSGGMHLYTLATGKGNRAGILPGIDYRGQGGYVLAPPSVVIKSDQVNDAEGKYYWIDDLDLEAGHDHEPDSEWMVRIDGPKA